MFLLKLPLFHPSAGVFTPPLASLAFYPSCLAWAPNSCHTLRCTELATTHVSDLLCIGCSLELIANPVCQLLEQPRAWKGSCLASRTSRPRPNHSKGGKPRQLFCMAASPDFHLCSHQHPFLCQVRPLEPGRVCAACTALFAPTGQCSSEARLGEDVSPGPWIWGVPAAGCLGNLLDILRGAR